MKGYTPTSERAPSKMVCLREADVIGLSLSLSLSLLQRHYPSLEGLDDQTFFVLHRVH
jgi:hypothetical protein